MTTPKTRHVYVRIPFLPTELPGLVLEWDRTDDGWRALVVYYREDESRAITTWVEAGQLRPVSGA